MKELQPFLRVLYCIKYEKFLELMEQPDNDYATDKFVAYKKDLARFIMELDDKRFEVFCVWARATLDGNN